MPEHRVKRPTLLEAEVEAGPVKGQPITREVVTPQAIRLQVKTSHPSVQERTQLAEMLDLTLIRAKDRKRTRRNSHPINVKRENRIQMRLTPLAPIGKLLW